MMFFRSIQYPDIGNPDIDIRLNPKFTSQADEYPDIEGNCGY